ncbi:anhydro-N-acetylmuramic acid kinase [Variovorax sp. RHLX14]|uniref:anhydro-N-acetylmuramic acid kinase n=1 Tax=Variovorax sp. RHLX14 TaxID=1259731 RepID=UPI003F45BDD7
MTGLYIGLMSGTSLDGVDGVLVDLSDNAIRVLGHAEVGFPPALRTEFMALNTPGNDEIHRAALAGNGLSGLYADVVHRLLSSAALPASAITAIGAHGQTVRHRPGAFDGVGYTVQINNPALLAESTGIDVIADFRSRDVAAGGQGAPLVPAFHLAVFGLQDRPVAVLNIGGISNISLLPATRHSDAATVILGFDCGPGNALMDQWCRIHTGKPFDADGRWAASGTVEPALLARFLTDPYFSSAPPKSTGRDLFHSDWLEMQLAGRTIAPVDVQATLTELTAVACANDLRRHGGDCRELVVCGGGAFNTHLMARLAALLPGVDVVSSAERGLPPQQVEAAAFAWLAKATVQRRPGNLPSVTGARGARVLGAVYPA